MVTPNDTPALARLLAAVRVLSKLGSGTLEGKDPGTKPDRLAIAFDEAYTAYVGQLSELPSENQMEALQRLDQQLERMSDPAQADTLWTADAMKRDPAWALVRSISLEILLHFGEGRSNA